jgi:hypothetical protein
MTHPSVDVENTISDARRIQAEFVLTELELGLTFLDIAANTREPRTTRRCVRNAVAALRTANRFLRGRAVDSDDRYIRQRREELCERLNEALEVNRRPA